MLRSTLLARAHKLRHPDRWAAPWGELGCVARKCLGITHDGGLWSVYLCADKPRQPWNGRFLIMHLSARQHTCPVPPRSRHQSSELAFTCVASSLSITCCSLNPRAGTRSHAGLSTHVLQDIIAVDQEVGKDLSTREQWQAVGNAVEGVLQVGGCHGAWGWGVGWSGGEAGGG